MEDCTMLEQIFSHAVPQLFAAMTSVIIIAVGMFCYDWRLAAALFWVVPLGIATLLLSRRKLGRAFQQVYDVKRGDRKSTRLNSSHANISYAVFCLKKKNSNYFS